MTKVTDTFDRADSTSLGASWSEVVGDWAIVSNQCECDDNDGATGYYARYETNVGSSDMYAEAVTNSTQTASASNAGVAARMRAAANTSYQLTTHLNDSCAFWRIVAGSETQIATFTAAVASGDRIRIEAAGRTLRAKINDTLVALAQDANITDGQRGGLNGYNDDGSGDVVRLNNFEAGALTDDLVAPYVADWSAQTARVTTATSTPTVPSQVATGDLVCVLATVRATTSAITAPAGQGWSEVQLASGNSLRSYLFAKIWGLGGGQTDDTTPDFTKDTGSVGFFTTAFIIRNPAHGTTPWVSVAAAIPASDQQSNAAAANATAPSVSHTGNNRTVIRLFSSADDNALATPSEGVLVFGGAAYDATDIAQAMSIREDVNLGGSTGTATVAETVNGNDANNGITLVVAIPSGSTVNATASAPLGLLATATALPTVNATAAASLGGVSTAVAVPTVIAAAAAPLGGTATATATRQTSATAAAALGGTGAATATRQTFPVAVAALGGTGTATATRQTFPIAAAALGGTGTATATRQTSATAAAALGGTSSTTATVTHNAVASSTLGGSVSAAAGVSHIVAADTALGFDASAFATDGSVIQAVGAAELGSSVTATADVAHIAQAVAALGGSSSAAAIPQHAAVLAALLGGTATATGRVTHNAIAFAALGFVAAGAVQHRDPNPAHVAFGDSGGFTFTEAVGVQLEEAAAA